MNAATVIGLKIIDILLLLLEVYVWVIIGNSILSWFLPPNNTLRQFLDFLTEPVVGPFRRLMSRWTARSAIPIDISPILAVLAIALVQRLIILVINWAF